MVIPTDPCYSRAVRPEPEAGKTSAPAALRHRQTYQLARLAAVVRGLCAKHLASAGLRQHQHAILCCLAEFGPECQSDIAARLSIDSGDMVAFVDDLERAGLVSRHRDERDRRRQILILAPLDTSETDELYRLMLRVLAHHEPGAWP
jgi:DNA-binding MarR family transcriptional regulator